MPEALKKLFAYYSMFIKKNYKAAFAAMVLALMSFSSSAQPTIVVDSINHPGYVIVLAGKPQYNRNKLYKLFWGEHYRKEWLTPVKVKVISLDTVFGGLTPILAGGGRQTQTLRLQNPDKKQYVLRSIDKTFSGALPDIARGTFIENLVNDQVTIAHPYSAITIPSIISAAGVYHTQPQIVYVPRQERLGEFNDQFGNMLFLLEERADESWEDADNFGNTENAIGTTKLFENIFEKNTRLVDQNAYVRARLFDMFIGDWGRHEDQWRWASFEEGDYRIYRPIPRDRDQVYTKFDGLFIKIATSIDALEHLQNFDHKIDDVEKYNFPARNLDRQLSNEVSQQTWINIAKDLQLLLTDSVIEAGIKQLPPEVYDISGPEMIAKLKSRRKHLVKVATDYYKFLAKEVDIVGSLENEIFEVKRLNDNETQVSIYKMSKKENINEAPFYSRIFYRNETDEIRLYGLTGNDIYNIEGNVSKGITVRIIGGPERDSYNDKSSIPGAVNHTKIYDNKDNEFNISSETKLHISDNPFIHEYQYESFKYNDWGLKKTISFNSEEGLYVGIGYGIKKYQWRKYPFGYEQRFGFRYSLTQGSFSTRYSGVFNQLIGNWNLTLNGAFYSKRLTNYFGVGNETEREIDSSPYYRLRSKDFFASIGLNKILWHRHLVNFGPFYQSTKIVRDESLYVTKVHDDIDFERNYFGGLQVDYAYENLDNIIVPTRGLHINSSVSFTQNLKHTNKSFMKYAAQFTVYLPLGKNLSLGIRTGGATITGEPEFYQLNHLGGNVNLRGYRRFRFYGKTMFFNNNELQWIKNVKTYLFNGKAGLVGVLDNGRVWQPGENSDKWHLGYGAGVMIAPFNRISATLTFSRSREENLLINARLNKIF